MVKFDFLFFFFLVKFLFFSHDQILCSEYINPIYTIGIQRKKYYFVFTQLHIFQQRVLVNL